MLKERAMALTPADVGAATSVGVMGATWVADLAIGLQILATVVAVVAGISAACYHIERFRQLRNKRKK